jgi:hypothetical protein
MIRSRRAAGHGACRLSHGGTGPKVEAHSIAIQIDSGPGDAGTSGPCVRETIAVLRFWEPQSQPFQGEPAPLADDEVVEQLDSEQVPGRHDLHREGHIGRRGRRIAGGVVMDRDEGGRLLAHRIAEDLSVAP